MSTTPLFTLTWAKRWEQPICHPSECSHGNEFGPEILTINQRLEPAKRGQHRIAMDGAICMNCGTDTTGNLSAVEGLSACMEEHGWYAYAVDRLYDIVEYRKDDLSREPAVPLWFAYAWDWPWPRIKSNLERGALAREARS